MSVNLFQIIATASVALLFALTLLAMMRGIVTRRGAALWTLLWLVTAVAILRPGVTSTVARTLGIGRGADLVLYCAVVAMMVGFLMVYVRLRRLRREMTLLVRRLAVRDAAEGSAPAHTSTPRHSDETTYSN